ncbi:MAG: phage terminase large subunit [Bacteroidales bacterium]|nr:phage terminase large subunit [Bacteroidales bacterium]
MKADALLYQKWKEHCAAVESATSLIITESSDNARLRVGKLLNDYEAFASYYFPHYITDPCADFHLEAAKKIKSDPNIFAILEWPREHAKSVHADIIIPLFLKAHKELNGMIIVGKNETDACMQLSQLQAELEFNQRYINDFGKQKKLGSWEDGEFITTDNILFRAYGRGQSPRGLRLREKRPNYCAIDDIDDDEIVQNPDRVEKVVDWILGSLYNALDIRKSRMVVVGNRIHQKSILAHLVGDIEEGSSKRKGIWHSKVLATVDGTFTGKPSWHQKFTSEQLQRRFERIGYYMAMREFFHKPIIKGKVFKREWIVWGKIPKLSEMDHIVCYFDPSYKAKTTNDFKAIKVWGKKGLKLYCIDAFVKQTTLTEAIKWMYDFYEATRDIAAVEFYMEEVFMQDTFYDDFEAEARIRGYYLPIRGDTRHKPDKFSRIAAIAPLWERGLVIYNQARKTSAHMITGIEQTLAFQKGSAVHDDGPDADEGAIFILQRRGRVENFDIQIGLRNHKSIY